MLPAPALPAAALSVALTQGTPREWQGKQLLAAAGLATPSGALAHKTVASGVLLNIADDTALRQGWAQLHANIARHAPGLQLDGMLVETLAAKGLELMVSAVRDAQWGPVLMVGLGGIWVEALGDVQLLSHDLPHAAIVQRLKSLKAARLLQGFRGVPAVDLDAVARAVATIGRLMLQRPDIAEIDVNPLLAYGPVHGVLALDALVATK